MNKLSSFNDFALTRSEMKGVKGGQCYIKDGANVSKCTGLEACKSLVSDGWGQNYCCDGCATASWCQNGQCP